MQLNAGAKASALGNGCYHLKILFGGYKTDKAVEPVLRKQWPPAYCLYHEKQ